MIDAPMTDEERTAAHRAALKAKQDAYRADQHRAAREAEQERQDAEAAGITVWALREARQAEANRQRRERDEARRQKIMEQHAAQEAARIEGMDWAERIADDLMGEWDEDCGYGAQPEEIATALRAAKQAGADEERARIVEALRFGGWIIPAALIDGGM